MKDSLSRMHNGGENLRDGAHHVESGISSVQLCWIEVRSDLDTDADELPLINQFQINRMLPKRRNQHIAGRRCITDLIRKRGLNPSLGKLNLTSDGLRFTSEDDTEFAVSIAHSETLAVAALFDGGKRIGIDCEPLNRDISDGALQEFCTPEEIQVLLNESHLMRLHYWMVKEAVGKATGEGMAASRRIRVASNEATLDLIQYSIRSIPEPIMNHQVVIATLHSDSP